MLPSPALSCPCLPRRYHRNQSLHKWRSFCVARASLICRFQGLASEFFAVPTPLRKLWRADWSSPTKPKPSQLSQPSPSRYWPDWAAHSAGHCNNLTPRSAAPLGPQFYRASQKQKAEKKRWITCNNAWRKLPPTPTHPRGTHPH